MGAFEFQALDARGRTRKGLITADTARQVREQLRGDGMTPLLVTEVGQRSDQPSRSGPSTGSSRRKISTTELAVLTRQFSTLLTSGMTIEDTLSGLISQSENHQVKSILTGIRSMIMEGRSLADAMRAYPRAFSELYTASVAAGEQTGRLAEVLERLADYVEARQGIQQRIGVALVYPVILTVVAILIVVGLVTYVVPQVVSVFEDTGQTLPLLTVLLISFSEFLREYGLVILGVIAGLLVVGVIGFRLPGPRTWLDGAMLRLPLFGRLTRGLNTSRMARTLAIMVNSGVPLLTAMRSSAGVVSNRVMQKAILKASDEVTEGVSVSRALARTGRFPPLLVQMVASGESSGQLDAMLEKAASVTERELESRISVLVGLFEPFMILLMGAVVLTIVLAILLPIFDLNQLIG